MFFVNSLTSSNWVTNNSVIIQRNNYYIIYATRNIYFFNTSYVYLSKIYDLIIDPQTKTIFSNHWYISILKKLNSNSINRLLLQFWVMYFMKIRYAGKGYKLYLKKTKRLHLQFGLSHKSYTSNPSSFYYLIIKGKMMFYGYNKKTLHDFLFNLIRRRYINIFTVRGMRFSRQWVFKKTGKVSAYR